MAVKQKCSKRLEGSFYKKKLLSAVNNQRGIAMVEMLPLLVIFVMIFGLTFGFWTSIHSGTLSSIGARHYAFEVLNNRTHFVYHRDTQKPDNKAYYKKNGYRFFAVIHHQEGDDPKLEALEKKLNLFDGTSLMTSGEFIKKTESGQSDLGQSGLWHLPGFRVWRQRISFVLLKTA